MKHVFIIGGGSAATTAAYRAHAHGWRVTLANEGLPIGGTCLNVGCVPSKFFIRASAVMHESRHPRYEAIPSAPRQVDWPTLVREKQALVDELRIRNYEQALPELDRLEWIKGRARFLDAHTVAVGKHTWTPDFVLVATGASTRYPDVPGLFDGPLLTNETIYDLPEQPASLIVLGGGYIALEVAQMMQRFGTEVTVLQRSKHILSDQPVDLTDPLLERLREEGLRIETGTHLEQVRHTVAGVEVDWTRDGQSHTCRAAGLFIGTGRKPNTSDLNLLAAGLTTGPRDELVVDEYGRTAQPHIFGAGDVLDEFPFVYTASMEAEIVVDNMRDGPSRQRTYEPLPWVVFTDPQVAGVGLSPDEAQAKGIPCETAELPVNRWPRFRVSQDTFGFLRLYRNPKTDQLLGARALAPEAGDLMTDLARAIRHEVTTRQLAEELTPYLTLTEGIARAADRFHG